MKIRLKLPLALAAAMSLLLAAALFGVSTPRQSLMTCETTVSEIVDHERRVSDVALQFKTQVQEWKNTLLRGRDAQARDKHWAAFQRAEARVREQTEALLKHMAADQGRQLVEGFLSAHKRMGQGYRKGHADFVAANVDPVAGDAAVAGVDREATELLVQAGNRIEALSKSVGQDAAEQGHRAVDVSLGVMLAVFAAGIVGALWFSRSITRPLQRAVATAQDVAAGAARAGEQGRGFAVVAGEVRSLAQRGAAAAREIKTLIEDSVDRVRQGTELVDQAGTTMSDVVASIQRVSAVVAEISAASSEQSTGVAQVGLAMSQIDEATQRNAALMEESMAAADSLRQQADSLVRAVAVFRTAA